MYGIFVWVIQIRILLVFKDSTYSLDVYCTPQSEWWMHPLMSMLRFEKQLIVISRVYCGMTCTEITHGINLSKISRENSFVPRSGIFSTSSGTFCTRPWYKKYQYWNFNPKQVVEEKINFWWSDALDNLRKDVSLLRQDKYFVPSLHIVFLIVMLTGSALIWNRFINPCVINATGT